MDCVIECSEFVRGGTIHGDRYEIIEPINQGSFGWVYLARDNRYNKEVALKCVPKTLAEDGSTPLPDQVFDDEINCHKELGHHPNIVSMIDNFETKYVQFLVLEYCCNGDLYDAVHKDSGITWTSARIRDWFLQLTRAVGYMHSKGWAHRDIKPENIFIQEDGSLKLGDFGLATNDKWSHDPAVGSDPYMAPEQYDCGDYGYDPVKADAWSICICLLHVLFKKNPFQSPSFKDPSFQKFCENSYALKYSYQDMTDGTFEVIKQGLTTRPEERDLSTLREKIRHTQYFIHVSLPIPSTPVVRKNPIPWTSNLKQQATPASYGESLFSDSDQNGRSWDTNFPMSFGSDLPSSLGSTFQRSKPGKSLSSMFPDEDMGQSWDELFELDMMEQEQRQQAQSSDVSVLEECKPSTVNSRANALLPSDNVPTAKAVPIPPRPAHRRHQQPVSGSENYPLSSTSPKSKQHVGGLYRTAPSKGNIDKWDALGMHRKNNAKNMNNCHRTQQQQHETMFPMSPPSPFAESPLSRNLLLTHDWRKKSPLGKSNCNASTSPPPRLPSRHEKRPRHSPNRRNGKKSALLCSNWRRPAGLYAHATTALTTHSDDSGDEGFFAADW